MWVVKLNAAGDIQWEKTLGGSHFDSATSIQQTTDGGYILAGGTMSNDGDVTGGHEAGFSDMWIVKLDADGEIDWDTTLGGSMDEAAIDIQQTADGGYILVGITNSDDWNIVGSQGNGDIRVIKLNSDGSVNWEKALGGSDYDSASSIRQTADGGYILTGFTASNDGDVSGNHGDLDGWVVKLDASGNVEWKKTLGGSAFDYASSIRQTTDGGYIVSGSTRSNDGDVSGNHGAAGTEDAWVVKLDDAGNILWQKTLGGNAFDIGYDIRQTADGGYIMTGSSESNDGDISGNHGDLDMWVVKLSPESSSSSSTASLTLSSITDGSGTLDFAGATVTLNASLDTVTNITINTQLISPGGLNFQIGANADQSMTVTIDNLSPEALGLETGLPGVLTREDAENSLSLLDDAIQYASSARVNLGAKQNALEHILSNVSNAAENQASAESTIRDAEMAWEIAEMSKSMILSQVSQAMLLHANQAPRRLLKLLG